MYLHSSTKLPNPCFLSTFCLYTKQSSGAAYLTNLLSFAPITPDFILKVTSASILPSLLSFICIGIFRLTFIFRRCQVFKTFNNPPRYCYCYVKCCNLLYFHLHLVNIWYRKMFTLSNFYRKRTLTYVNNSGQKCDLLSLIFLPRAAVWQQSVQLTHQIIKSRKTSPAQRVGPKPPHCRLTVTCMIVLLRQTGDRDRFLTCASNSVICIMHL